MKSWAIKNSGKIFTFFIFIVISITCIYPVILESIFSAELVNYLRIREIEFGFISYAYITASISIISLGTISFTIMFGRLHFFASEISANSFNKKILNDRRPKWVFYSLMFCSLFLLFLYLFFDMTITPLKYVLILLAVILTVILLFGYLISLISKESDGIQISENNIERLERIRKNIEKLLNEKDKVSENARNLDKLLHINPFTIFYTRKLSSILRTIEIMGNEYISLRQEVVNELGFLISKSLDKKDYQRLQILLSITTNLAISQIERFGTQYEFNPYKEKAFGSESQNVKFIKDEIIPLYKRHKHLNFTDECSTIINNEISNLIVLTRVLLNEFSYIRNASFKLIFDDVSQFFMEQINGGNKNAVHEYIKLFHRIVHEFNTQYSRFIYLKISSEIKHNAIQFFKLVKYEKFNKLVELQTDLVIKSFQFEYDEFDEDVINHFRSFFSVFEVYYLQEDSMHTLIDTVLETLYDSVVSELTKIYLKLKESGKIAELLSANTKQRLFQIINGVGEAIPLIALSSTKTRFTYNNTHDSFGRFVHNILLGIDMSITISKELVNQNVSSLHHFDFLEIMTYGTSLYTEYANLTIIREFNPKIQASISDLFKDDIKMLINHFKSYIDSHGWVDENEYLRKNLEKLIKDAINSKTFFNWGIDSYFDIFEYFLLYKMVQKDGIFSIISLITLSLHVENHEIVFNKMDEIFEKAELKSIINQIKMIPHDTKLVDVWISSKDNIEYLELDKYNWIISKLDDTFKK